MSGREFIRLTDPEGHDVWIAKHWVTRIRHPTSGQHAAGTKAVVVMGNAEQAVTESVEQVLTVLEEKP